MNDGQPIALLTPGDTKAVEAHDRHKRARSIVDLIFAIEPGTPKRWRAIEQIWYMKAPITHLHERREAIRECAEIRATLVDKKFGKSLATLNHGRDADGKQVQHLRLLGNMPESLYWMLKRFDPLGLGLARGEASHKMKVRLYNEFKEYKIPEYL